MQSKTENEKWVVEYNGNKTEGKKNLMRKAFVNGSEDVKSGAGNAGLVRMIPHGRRNRIASNPRYPSIHLCSPIFPHFRFLQQKK